jgi:hypothetical protein
VLVGNSCRRQGPRWRRTRIAREAELRRDAGRRPARDKRRVRRDGAAPVPLRLNSRTSVTAVADAPAAIHIPANVRLSINPVGLGIQSPGRPRRRARSDWPPRLPASTLGADDRSRPNARARVRAAACPFRTNAGAADDQHSSLSLSGGSGSADPAGHGLRPWELQAPRRGYAAVTRLGEFALARGESRNSNQTHPWLPLVA